MKNSDINLGSFKQLGRPAAQLFARYRVLLFVVIVGGVYAFLVLRIGTLSNVQPDPNTLSASTKTLVTPRIDSSTVQKIQDLQDNNVNVQALFNQARQNPFQE